MIQLSNEYKRNLLFTNTNKALLELVKNASPQQLTQLKEATDVKSLLTSLFQEKLSGGKSDRIILEMLKSSPQFKALGNFTDNLKTLVKELKTSGDLPTSALEKFLRHIPQIDGKNIQTQIKNSGVLMESKIAAFIEQSSQPPIMRPTLQEIKTELSNLYSKLLSTPTPGTEKLLDTLESMIQEPAKITAKELKTLVHQLKEAPVPHLTAHDTAKPLPKVNLLLDTLKPALHSTLSSAMADDLKSTLMTLSQSIDPTASPNAPQQLEHIDKLLLQIDYHQLQSHLSASTSLFFPFAWDQLEEGSLSFKKKDGKKSYCNVHLKFKEYGELSLMMSLFDEHFLDIHFHAEHSSLHALITSHLPQLKQILSHAGFMLNSIRVLDQQSVEQPAKDPYSEKPADLYGGFEVKA